MQKYYRWMGYGMLAYMCVAATIAVGESIIHGPRSLFELAPGLLAFVFWGTSLGWLFVTMVRVAYVPYDDFPKHYTKARWVGIVAGALFFPILAVPAIISVRRLSRYNQLRRLSIDAGHVGESLRDSRESRRDSPT